MFAELPRGGFAVLWTQLGCTRDDRDEFGHCDSKIQLGMSLGWLS